MSRLGDVFETNQTRRVLAIVERTRAIRWWIDEQIAKGKSDDEIEATLPLAVSFITGRMTEAELRTRLGRS